MTVGHFCINYKAQIIHKQMKNEWWKSEYGGLKIPFSVFHSVTVLETVPPKNRGKYLSLGLCNIFKHRVNNCENNLN